MRTFTRTKLYWSLALILIVTIALAGSVAAQGDTSSTAIPLSNGVTKTGAVVGSRAGAFNYYTISYPGNYEVVSIVVSFSPGDPATMAGVGFVVYAADGFVIGRGSADGQPAPGMLGLQYSDGVQENWLIQIYNYLQGVPVSYSIVVTGLVPSTPTPTPTATPGPGVTRTTMFQEEVSGILSGNSGGAFVYYGMPYPADGTQVSIEMLFSPDNPTISPGVGFAIYGPQGLVAQAQGTNTPGVRQATFSSNIPGLYLLQVFNYINGVTINYSLLASDTSG